MAPTKTKKKPAPSGDAMDAPTVPAAAPVLSKEQQCFLQALLARGVIEVTKAEQMYREIMEDDTANEFTAFWGDITRELAFIDLEIRVGKYEEDDEMYMAVVNKARTDVAKLATRLSPQEIALFRLTLDEILRDDDSARDGVDFIGVLNVIQTQATQAEASGTQLTQRELQTQSVQRMSAADKESTLKSLVDADWLSYRTGGRLHIGPRSFLELREFILEQAPEHARAKWDKML